MRFLQISFFILLSQVTLLSQIPLDPTRDLFYAIFDNSYGMAEKALSLGANPNAIYTYERYSTECSNWVPAFSTAAVGNLKMLKLLKLNGADLKKTISTDDNCVVNSLLHVAAAYGSNEVLKFLINEEKIPVDLETADGRTALFDAVMNDRYETVKFLLEKGANPNIALKTCSTEVKRSPVYFAVAQQNHKIAALLLDRISISDTINIPLLHYAVENENLHATQILIEKGANKLIINQLGQTALELAKIKGNDMLVKILEKKIDSREKKILELLSNDATKKFELLNRKAPAIKLTNLNGNPVSSTSFPGNLLLVNVWATWCGPCIKEMPSFKELLKKLNRSDVKLLAVSIDQKLYKVQDFVKENPYPFVFLHDPDANIRSIFDGVVPATYIINKKGELVARVDGSIDWDKKEIRDFLEYLANEK